MKDKVVAMIQIGEYHIYLPEGHYFPLGDNVFQNIPQGGKYDISLLVMKYM